jgi:PAS domain S-box-containing protein
LIYELGSRQWQIAKLRQLLEGILPRNSFFNDFEVTHDFEGIGRRTMLLNARRLEDTGGRPARILLGIQDVSEVLQFQAAARESQTRYEALIDASAQIVWTTAPGGAVVEDSPSWRAFTGQTFEEWKGTGWLDALHPDDRERVSELWQRAVVERTPVKTEYRDRHASGDWRWTAVRAVPVWNPDGSVREWVGMNIDFTERKRAEEALRESEERFRGIFAQTLAGIAQTDLTGRFVQVNQRYCDIVRRSAEELSRLRLQDITHPDDLPRSLELLRPMIEGNGPPFVIEKRYVRPDESSVWVTNSVSFVRDRDGKPRNVVAVSLDLTDRKQAEESLREADHRKNEFLAMLAHELRNPLAPISNALEVLRLTEGNGEAVQSASAMMERQIGQMVRLVDDLLDVSRISRGKIELRTGRVELASVVNHAVEAARPLLEKKGLGFSMTLPPPQSVYLNADPIRLAQVVGNLLNNACKFTGEGGQLWLTVAVASEKNAKHGNGGARSSGARGWNAGSEALKLAIPHALIRVRDTGIGIAADQRTRIFEMFSQVDTSLERTQGGLGIGLTLAKNLVELHGGELEVHSAGLGQGSEFVVRLPVMVETPKAQSPEPTVSEPKTTTARRILVVDDNVDSAESLAMLLTLTGNETRSTYDGLEAVEAAATFRPDVILPAGVERLRSGPQDTSAAVG